MALITFRVLSAHAGQIKRDLPFSIHAFSINVNDEFPSRPVGATPAAAV